MKKKRNLISEINNMLDDKKKLTLESVIFSENDDPREYMGDDEDEYPIDDTEDSEKDIPMPNDNMDSSVQSDINKIRQICIKAIARLASNPNSNDYISMKKIWDLCDKTIEPKKENNL